VALCSRDSDKVDGTNTKNKKKTPENKVDDLSVNTSKNKGNHTLMNYGILFWGYSPYSIHIFRLQKSVIRIITSTKNRVLHKCVQERENPSSSITIHLFSIVFRA
jgi:hypothetical protein